MIISFKKRHNPDTNNILKYCIVVMAFSFKFDQIFYFTTLKNIYYES